MGLATAKLLASKGAKLSLADVQEQSLQRTVSLIESTNPGAQVLSSIVDVSSRSQVDACIARTVETFGKLDGAANIAAVVASH
jgi:NAD(P)-dependent dehydrogenase (short-subunit alcohol dehydrogenase family)